MNFKLLKRDFDSKKLENAIADFESHLDFEFVPVIANKSSYVEHIGWVLSLLILIICLWLIDFTFNYLWIDSWLSPLPFYLLSPIFSYFLGFFIDKSDRVDRFFISQKERARQVQEKAELFFFRNQLHEVQSNNVLLLYISMMEKHIVLYHDQRVSFDKMNDLDQKLLKTLQNSFKKNQFEQGLLECLQILKQALEPQFKRSSQENNPNFVPNKIIWIDELPSDSHSIVPAK